MYEINPLECPKCKAQMRVIAFIQDTHSIKDIMKAQGIPDFQAPPPIPKFIDAQEAIDKLYPFTTCLSQRLTTSKRRFFGDGMEAVYMGGYFLLLSSHHSSLFEPLIPFPPTQLYAS